jgi:hypothetical protein
MPRSPNSPTSTAPISDRGCEPDPGRCRFPVLARALSRLEDYSSVIDLADTNNPSLEWILEASLINYCDMMRSKVLRV